MIQPGEAWLGREGSNLRMAESKSAWLFSALKPHLEEMAESLSSNASNLAVMSKWEQPPSLT
jgi:hypothetical protein